MATVVTPVHVIPGSIIEPGFMGDLGAPPHHHHHHGGGGRRWVGGGWGPAYYPDVSPVFVIEPPAPPACPADTDYVLATDGKVYENACLARAAGAQVVRHVKRTKAGAFAGFGDTPTDPQVDSLMSSWTSLILAGLGGMITGAVVGGFVGYALGAGSRRR